MYLLKKGSGYVPAPKDFNPLYENQDWDGVLKDVTEVLFVCAERGQLACLGGYGRTRAESRGIRRAFSYSRRAAFKFGPRYRAGLEVYNAAA